MSAMLVARGPLENNVARCVTPSCDESESEDIAPRVRKASQLANLSPVRLSPGPELEISPQIQLRLTNWLLAG